MVKRLQDAERPGAPATFSLEQVLQLFAIACENPQPYGRPISHWTPRELAVKAKITAIFRVRSLLVFRDISSLI